MRMNLIVLVGIMLLTSPGLAKGQKTVVTERQLAPVPPAQVVLREIPLEMMRRFSLFKPALKPSAKSWVDQQSHLEAQKSAPDIAVLKTAIRNRFPTLIQKNSSVSSPGAGEGDIEAIAFLVLIQATKELENDLKAAAAEVKAMNEVKQKLRDLMSGINAATAGNNGGASARCRTPFCLSLPAQLSALTMATRGFQRPVKLYAPADPSFANLSGLQGQMKASLDSLDSMSTWAERRIQQYQDRRAKLLEALFLIMKKTSETQAGIIQNLK